MIEWKARRAALVAADAESAEWLRFESEWIDAFATRFVGLARGKLLNDDGSPATEAQIRDDAEAAAIACLDTQEDPEEMADAEWLEWLSCSDA